MTNLNLDNAHARQLLLPAYDEVHLVLVGCGGTGSWLAPAIARIGRLLGERFGKRVEIIFVDPDTVEEKNVYRQNFCQAEVGRCKSETLAYRYGLAWGLPIEAVAARFNAKLLSGRVLTVVIGCVDNAPARRSIRDALKTCYPPTLAWWLDCGNERNAGQVLLGCAALPPKGAADLPGRCSWLPLPSAQHPDLVEGEAPAGVPTTGMSCAELALVDSQGMAINQRMAAEAADYLARMLITRDLRKYATYIDLESGVCRSEYITDTRLDAWRK